MGYFNLPAGKHPYQEARGEKTVIMKAACAILVLFPMGVIFVLGGIMLFWFSMPQIFKLITTTPVPVSDLFAPLLVSVMGLLSLLVGIGSFRRVIESFKA